MPGPVNHVIASASSHVPGLRRLPMLKLLALAEVAFLAHRHATRLDPNERRRLYELVKIGGKTHHFSRAELNELSALLAKTEPRLFVGEAADRLSPIPLPKVLVRGRRKRGQAPEPAE